MGKQDSKLEVANSTINLGSDITQLYVKRDLNTISYMIAIYATIITVLVTLISILPIDVYVRAGIIVTTVIWLYYFLLRTTKGRVLIAKELVRLANFEEGFKSK